MSYCIQLFLDNSRKFINNVKKVLESFQIKEIYKNSIFYAQYAKIFKHTLHTFISSRIEKIFLNLELQAAIFF